MIIKVSATVSFEYDTRDGLVENEMSAVEDTLSAIDSGDIPAAQYTIVTEVTP